MRCDLAAALLHAPAVVFLDEPTIGLDLSVKEQVREFIADMQEKFGTTLLITTHDLKDITETCDRLLLLDKGTLLFDGSIKAFEKKFANESGGSWPKFTQPANSAALEKAGAGGEMKKHGGRSSLPRGHRLVVEYREPGAAPALTQLLLEAPEGGGFEPGKDRYRDHRNPHLPATRREGLTMRALQPLSLTLWRASIATLPFSSGRSRPASPTGPPR